MTRKPGRAIVLGGSISGILAARVLSESYETVTIFDRDVLPTEAVNRRGAPHGAHTHALLARGRQVLEELFPGFTADLTARGGTPLDLQRDCVWINDGHRLPRVESGLQGLAVSRPALESYVRSRILAFPNIEIKEGYEVLGLLTSADCAKVSGAYVRPVDGSEEQEAEADLVVDATGRGNRGPTWLAAIGHEKPAEDRIDSGMNYVTREFRRVEGDADFGGAVFSPWPELRRGGVAVATEGDRWTVTLIGVGDEVPPPDAEGYLAYAKTLAGNEIYDLLSKAEPLTPPLRMRLPVSVRRRYERLPSPPEGFLAFGDAICSFNPAYGQGMTVAAAEAVVLRDCLLKGSPQDLAQRFFAEVAKLIDVPWDIAVGADLRYPEVEGPRNAKVGFLNGYVARVHQASLTYPPAGRAFLAVANLMAPPTRLFSPGILSRVLWSTLPTRRSARHRRASAA
jgi:2-polyprenyl-6-methoxyphenol hydroxylase-like FAD-dependent oxidoreductase